MNDIIPHRVWVGIVLMLAAVLSVSAQGDTALHDTDIDGIWNQEDPEQWLSLIQIPIE